MQALRNLPWACHVTGQPALSSAAGSAQDSGQCVLVTLPRNEPAEFRAVSPVTVRQESGSSPSYCGQLGSQTEIQGEKLPNECASCGLSSRAHTHLY